MLLHKCYCLDVLFKRYFLELEVQFCTVVITVAIAIAYLLVVEAIVRGKAYVLIQCIINGGQPTFEITRFQLCPAGRKDRSAFAFTEVLHFYILCALLAHIVIAVTDAGYPTAGTFI